MKTIKIDYKILVNGFAPNGNYEADGFILKTGRFNEDAFDFTKHITLSNEFDINTNDYLWSCIVDTNTMEYRFFQSNEQFVYDVDYENIDSLSEIIVNNRSFLECVNDLETELRLIFNIPVLFEAVIMDVYDCNNVKLLTLDVMKEHSQWNRLKYKISDIDFYNNSRLHLKFCEYKKIHLSPEFNRAKELFSLSFNSDYLPLRFLLLISVLESIFTLSGRNISDSIAICTSQLLFGDNEKQSSIVYKQMRFFYEKRCAYIHGRDIDSITEEDELMLRKYVRIVVLTYWFMVISYGTDAKTIKKSIMENNIDVVIRLFAKSLILDTFEETKNYIFELMNVRS